MIWGVCCSDDRNYDVFTSDPTSDSLKYFRFDCALSMSSDGRDCCVKIVLSNTQVLYVNFETIVSTENPIPVIGSSQDHLIIRLSPFILSLQ